MDTWHEENFSFLPFYFSSIIPLHLVLLLHGMVSFILLPFDRFKDSKFLELFYTVIHTYIFSAYFHIPLTNFLSLSSNLNITQNRTLSTWNISHTRPTLHISCSENIFFLPKSSSLRDELRKYGRMSCTAFRIFFCRMYSRSRRVMMFEKRSSCSMTWEWDVNCNPNSCLRVSNSFDGETEDKNYIHTEVNIHFACTSFCLHILKE